TNTKATKTILSVRFFINLSRDKRCFLNSCTKKVRKNNAQTNPSKQPQNNNLKIVNKLSHTKLNKQKTRSLLITTKVSYNYDQKTKTHQTRQHVPPSTQKK